jgi:copper chaperone CopZ
MENKTNCCNSKKQKSNIGKGILYGILPHSFCIAFIVFSIIGATTLTALIKPLMLNVYFFPLLVVLSFALATISAIIYLKRNCSLTIKAVKNNRKYLLTLYSSVIGVNLLLFLVIFPLVANFSFSNIGSANSADANLTVKTISVAIPCSGHAPLVIDEVKKIEGVLDVKYFPMNNFEITFDLQKLSLEQILSAEIFKSFKAKEVNG